MHAGGWVCCWHRGTGGTSIPPQIVLLQLRELFLCCAGQGLTEPGDNSLSPPAGSSGRQLGSFPSQDRKWAPARAPQSRAPEQPRGRGAVPARDALCCWGEACGRGWWWGGSVSLCLLFASVSLQELGMACFSLGTALEVPDERLGGAILLSLSSFVLGSPSERGQQAPGAGPGYLWGCPCHSNSGCSVPHPAHASHQSFGVGC